MSDADLGALLREQIEREVADWPPLSTDQESAVALIFASGKAMRGGDQDGQTAA